MHIELDCSYELPDPNNTEMATYRIHRHHDGTLLAQIETSERTLGERIKTVYLSRCIYGEQEHLDRVFDIMHLTLSWKPFTTSVEVPDFQSVI